MLFFSLLMSQNCDIPYSYVHYDSFGNKLLPCSCFIICFMILWQELDHVVEELEKFAVVHLLQRRSIISLIGNVQRSSLILEKVRPPHGSFSYLTSCYSEIPCTMILALF